MRQIQTDNYICPRCKYGARGQPTGFGVVETGPAKSQWELTCPDCDLTSKLCDVLSTHLRYR